MLNNICDTILNIIIIIIIIVFIYLSRCDDKAT